MAYKNAEIESDKDDVLSIISSDENSISSEEFEELDDDEQSEEEYNEDEYVEDENLKTEKELLENDDDEEEDCIYHTKYLEKEKINKLVPNEERITTNKMTKYEYAKIIGVRATQIAQGAKVMLKNITITQPDEIAKEELKAGMLPFIIERPYPNGNYECWKVSELHYDV